MIIREYHPRDFDAICEIDRLCFEPGVSYTADEMREWLALPAAFALVGEDDQAGRVGGFVLARKTRARNAHIITIDVLPEYRRSGLGASLMQGAHEKLRKRDVRRVQLEVSVENAAALRFYERLGYVVAGRIPRYYLDRIDAWAMVKELNH